MRYLNFEVIFVFYYFGFSELFGELELKFKAFIR